MPMRASAWPVILLALVPLAATAAPPPATHLPADRPGLDGAPPLGGLPPPLHDLPYVVDETGDRMVGPLRMRADLVMEAGDFACEGCVGEADLGPAAVTAPKLRDGAVGTPALAGGAVTAGKLADAAVEARHLAPGAVGAAAIADGSVGSADLAPGAVDTAALADGSVTAAKLSPGVRKPAAILSGARAVSTAFAAATYHPMATADNDMPMLVRSAGVLRNFAVHVDFAGGMTLGETVEFAVLRNGAETPLKVVLAPGAAQGTVLADPDTAPVQPGDTLLVRAQVRPSQETAIVRFSWTVEVEAV